ncbi:MAG: ATP-binding protein [Kiritimatiellae bacterium]|nr:ATP-binding protein [Kiritimatiellia bacterium]
MAKPNDIIQWFGAVRGQPVPKFITGLRGTGKTGILLWLRDRILSEGVPAENTILLDSDDPVLRRMMTHEQVLDHVFGRLPSDGPTYIFIREAAALPGAEVVIGTLAASQRREIFATSSSRRLLDCGLAGYFSTRLAHYEVLPGESDVPPTPDLARARWNEIFLNDVLAPNRILEVSIAGRIAGWLSDHIGEPLSLRSIAAAVSPARRILSPHTVESYLASLEDAHLVEKVLRWDTDEEWVQKTGYRYFFTDPGLRLAHFGPAPDNEARRMALNRAWLHLRRAADEVFTTSGSQKSDFISRTEHAYTRWKLNEKGVLERLKAGNTGGKPVPAAKADGGPEKRR